MHWCPVKHPDLASCKCFDRSSTYTANKRKCSAARPSTPLALPPFKCLNELVMLEIENLRVHSVSLSVLLDTSDFKSQICTLFHKDS